MGDITNLNNFPQPNYNRYDPQQTQSQSAKKGKTWLFITITVIILIVAGYFLLFNKGDNEDNPLQNNNGESTSDNKALEKMLCTDLVSKEKLQEVYETQDVLYIPYETYYDSDLEKIEDNKPTINTYAYESEEINCYYNFKGSEKIYVADINKLYPEYQNRPDIIENLKGSQKDYWYGGDIFIHCQEQEYNPETWLDKEISLIEGANQQAENSGYNNLKTKTENLDIGKVSYINYLEGMDEISGIFSISVITENSLCVVSIEGRGKQETIALAREIETSLSNIEF